MIPGLPVPFISASGGGIVSFSITSGNILEDLFGYLSSDFGTDTGLGATGSITDDTAPGGGVIHALFYNDGSNFLIVSDNTPELSQITIDSNPYALTDDGTENGYTFYAFSIGVQRIFDASTYAITVME